MPVLLLDELDKAHPAVFDLLLSLLGVGRLNDAWGRTADFTNECIVMTSNLGVQQAHSPVGFRAPKWPRIWTYRANARRSAP